MTVATVYGLRAEAIDELMALRDEAGNIDPLEVVDKARESDSALHGYFEWDDTKAAFVYRLEQADHIIRRLRYRVDNDKATVVRAFVSVIEDNKRRYVDTLRAVADFDLRDQVRKSILADLKALRHKISAFEEFANVAAAIDTVLNDGD